MKTTIRYLATALGLAATLPLAFAADEAKPAPKTEKKEMRVLSRPGAAGEKEVVTFLGVETAPVSPTLTAQLGLAEGQGLVVNRVSPDSPAAGALKEHDILLKLDDQILIEQRQLLVLVRGHKEGDEVTLTYLRAGKQATAKVKLAKHEVPKMSWLPAQPGEGINILGLGRMLGRDDADTGHSFNFQVLPPGSQARSGADIDHFLGLMDNGVARPGVQFFRQTRPGDRSVSVTVNTGNSHVVLDDDRGSLDLTIKDGEKSLVAKDKAGKEIFSGPVNTPEQRKALPEDVRGRLEKLEDSTQFSFKTDADFRGAETRILRPLGQGIALPRVPAAPAPRPQPSI